MNGAYSCGPSGVDNGGFERGVFEQAALFAVFDDIVK
jgi:hypothetical protein